MANDKNKKVVSVRLSEKAVKELENISGQWDISVSSVARSFILSCLYSLTSNPINWTRKEQTKIIARAMPQVIGKRSKREAIKKDTSEVDKLEEFLENRYKGLPSKDRKGNDIPEDDWEFAIRHRDYPCPCGSGKKYKKCHGA